MLTEQETARIRRAAVRSGCCITLPTMKRYFQQHQRARETGDTRTQEKIEYHLTYLNFHYECGLLVSGQYDKLQEVIKDW